jgi:hypothetical protein
MDKAGATWYTLGANQKKAKELRMSLLELIVSVDDFRQVFLPFWEENCLTDGRKT